MKCNDPGTWPEPSAEHACEDAGYGSVRRVRAWAELHPKVQNHEGRGSRGPLPIVVGTLVLVEVERLPRGESRREPRVLWLWWHGPEGTRPDLDLIWRSYIRRFDLEHTFRFLKQSIGMDDAEGSPPRAGRPVDVGGGGRFCPTQVGAHVCRGPAAALGETLRHRSPDAVSGPSRGFGAFGAPRHTRQAAETLRALTGTAQRSALGPGQALPGPQEERLTPHEDSERGSFAMEIKPIAKLSCLKRKLSTWVNKGK
jgi:hypothetical protein